jgi:CHAT domain-containing protein
VSEIGVLPSLADEVFKRVVQNYIGTAWEIDDAGAIEFMSKFYKKCLPDRFNSSKRGGEIGAAMLEARGALYGKRDFYGSLWLAYQHYGDPQFVL